MVKPMFNFPAPNPGATPLPDIVDVVMPCFSVLVDLELQHARKKHARFKGESHALQVIYNELGDLREGQFLDPARQSPLQILHQLVKLAAMCNRAAEDLGFLDVKGMELETLLYSRIESMK